MKLVENRGNICCECLGICSIEHEKICGTLVSLFPEVSVSLTHTVLHCFREKKSPVLEIEVEFGAKFGGV